MEPKALRDRVGRKIRAARLKQGMEPRDLAYALNVNDRTLERWENGEVYPQLRNRKAVAEKLPTLTLDDLQPDLEAEERELRDQLDRLEGMLQQLLDATPTPQQRAKDAARAADQRSKQRKSGSQAGRPGQSKRDQAS